MRGRRRNSLEATGGLEVPVITALAEAGLKVMRINPKRVRDFARAQGLLAKTDALDAHVLALFGARMQPPLRAWPTAERQQLAAWVARQRQLTVERAAERTRLSQATEPFIEEKRGTGHRLFRKRDSAPGKATRRVGGEIAELESSGGFVAHCSRCGA